MEWLYILCGVGLNAVVFGLWKPWSQAYAGEKGKNFARKEDLNEILAEVRAVTATQKEIESKLAGDLWNRQMRWNQKKEIYGALLEALDDLSRAYMALQIALQLKADPLAQNLQSEMQKKVNSRVTEISAAVVAFSKAFSLAHIFTSQECMDAISKCFPIMKTADAPTPEWASQQAQEISQLLVAVIRAAKRDLIGTE